jgi:diguanylate cyclase (GGDEF)-like protein
MRVVLVPVAGLVLAFTLFAAPTRSQTVSTTLYSASAGLTNIAIMSVQQLPNGQIIVGTQNGFLVFDGRRFIPLGPDQGLPVGGIGMAASLTAQGDLIAVYGNGAYIAHAVSSGTASMRMRFEPVAASVTLSWDTHRKVEPWRDGVVVTDHDRLLFVHRTGDGERIDLLESAQGLPEGTLTDVSALHADHETLWVGTGDGRVCQLTGKDLHCVPMPVLQKPTRVVAITQDAQGMLYARTLREFVTVDPARHAAHAEAIPHIGEQYENYQPFLTFAWSPQGQLVTQTDDARLLVRTGPSSKTGGWKTLSVDGERLISPLSALLFDRQGSLWIGETGRGVARVRGYGVFENFDRRAGLSGDFIWQVARQPGGPLWIATNTGIDALDTTSDRVVHSFGRAAFLLAVDKEGCIWQAAPDRVVRTDPVTGWQGEYPVRRVNGMLPASDHTLWLLSDRGGWLADTARRDQEPLRVAGMSGDYRSGVIDGTGTLWLLDGERLVARHRDGTMAVALAAWPHSGFVPNVVVAQGDHQLWMTGLGGVYRVTHDGDRVTQLTFYGPSDVGSDLTYVALVDRWGVWIGSDHGLALFNGQRWVLVTEADGLISNDVDQESLAEDTDGTIWAGTSQGLSHILQPGQFLRDTAPRPIISGMVFGGRPYDGGPIKYTRAPFTVMFGTLDYRQAQRIHFRYRLEGEDESWNETVDPSVRYASVSPGRHRFLLQGYDPDRKQYSDIVSVEIRMGRPWWESLPVLISEGLVLLMFGVAVWRVRIGLLLRQQRMLQKVVERQTAEIRTAHQALVRQSRLDSLTGLLNRGAIQSHLQSCLQERDQAGAQPLVIALVDVDYFKKINDQMGHLVGDEVLVEIGRLLRQGRHPGEEAGRYGGEEFLIVRQGDGDALGRLDEIRGTLTGHIVPTYATSLHVTVSAGVAEARAGETWQTLIGRADKALYRAKDDGRDRMVVAE